MDDRRRVLTSLLGGFGATALAGCIDATGESPPETVVQALSGNDLLWFDTIAALRAASGGDEMKEGRIAVVSGHSTAGDGGGGIFWWNWGSTSSDDGGTIIVTTATPAGAWKRIFQGAINVQWFGAKGDGVTDDFAAIAAARTASVAQQRGLYFPRTAGGGVYRHSSTIQHPSYSLLGQTNVFGLEMFGDVGVELHYAGTDACVRADAGFGSAMVGARMHDLIIVGAVNRDVAARYGVVWRKLAHSTIENVRIERVGAGSDESFGFRQEQGLGNRINIIISRNIRGFDQIPKYGICIDGATNQLGAIVSSTATRLVNCAVEGIYQPNSVAIKLDHADLCSIEGGTSEGNYLGLEITPNGGQHRIVDLWMESNTQDVRCASFWNQFENCKSRTHLSFSAGSYGNVVRGGDYQSVTSLSAYAQRYDACAIVGGLTDNATPGEQRVYWDQPCGCWSPRRHGDRVLTLAAINGTVGNGWVADAGGYMRSTAAGDFYVTVPVRTGDRIKSVTVSLMGSNQGPDLDSATGVWVVSANGALTKIGGGAVINPPSAWTDTTFDVTDTILGAGQSAYIRFAANAAQLRVGTIRITYDRP